MQCLAKTHDDAVACMDKFQFDIQNEVGGAPWLMTQDDVIRCHSQGQVFSDENGFYYEGRRTMRFDGPLVPAFTQPMHDGYTTQKEN